MMNTIFDDDYNSRKQRGKGCSNRRSNNVVTEPWRSSKVHFKHSHHHKEDKNCKKKVNNDT